MTDSVIAKNVAFVKAEIARAAAEAGRDPAEIRRLRGLLEKYVEMNSGFREVYLQYDYNA